MVQNNKVENASRNIDDSIKLKESTPIKSINELLETTGSGTLNKHNAGDNATIRQQNPFVIANLSKKVTDGPQDKEFDFDRKSAGERF